MGICNNYVIKRHQPIRTDPDGPGRTRTDPDGPDGPGRTRTDGRTDGRMDGADGADRYLHQIQNRGSDLGFAPNSLSEQLLGAVDDCSGSSDPNLEVADWPSVSLVSASRPRHCRAASTCVAVAEQDAVQPSCSLCGKGRADVVASGRFFFSFFSLESFVAAF